MGEKYVRVVFGAFEDDFILRPPEDTFWSEWFEKLSEKIWAHNSGLRCVHFVTPYESKPRWIGFLAFVLDYGDTWEPRERNPMAEMAWNRLREIVAKDGWVLPEGKYIVAFDE